MAVQVQTPIAVTSAAFTPITAKAFSRYTEIQEDGSGPPAGIIVKWPNGNVVEYLATQQPIRIGNPGGGAGPFVGVPEGGSSPNATATVYCSIKAVGATSSIQVSETN